MLFSRIYFDVVSRNGRGEAKPDEVLYIGKHVKVFLLTTLILASMSKFALELLWDYSQ